MNITERNTSDAEWIKRKRRGSECALGLNGINQPPTKSSKLSRVFIRLASESPRRVYADSDDGTYGNVHELETDVCRDTSDTDSSYTSDEGIATISVIEYEVASTSDSDNTNDSSSGIDDILLLALARRDLSSSTASDFAILADTEESDGTDRTDPELGRADYWKCIKCKNTQNNPLYRYCEKCYQIRKSNFPPRPKKNRKTRTARNLSIFEKRIVKTSSSDDDDMRNKNRKSGNMLTNNTIKNVVGNVGCGGGVVIDGNDVIIKVNKNQSNSVGESSDTEYDDSDIEINNERNKFLSKSPKLNKKYNHNNFTNEKNEGYEKLLSSSSSKSSSSTPPSSFIVLVDDKDNCLISKTSATTTNITTTSTNNTSSLNVNNKEINNINKVSLVPTISNNNNNIDNNNDNRITLDSSTASSLNLSTSSSSHNEKLNFINNEIIDDDKKLLIQQKIFKNVIGNRNMINSVTDIEQKTAIIPPRTLDLTQLNKDSGFSSSSSQELSPIIDVIEIKNSYNCNSSQETICSELEKIIPSSIADNVTNLFNDAFPSSPETIFPDSQYSQSLTQTDSVLSEMSVITDNEHINTASTANLKRKSSDSEITHQSKISRTSQTSDDYSESGYCIMCLSQPKNGVFVHSQFLHLCCCYKCAVKVWNKSKRCPICNGKVKNVMKLFVH